MDRLTQEDSGINIIIFEFEGGFGSCPRPVIGAEFIPVSSCTSQGIRMRVSSGLYVDVGSSCRVTDNRMLSRMCLNS